MLPEGYQIRDRHEDNAAKHADLDRTEENVNASTVILELQSKKNLEVAHQALLESVVGKCKSLQTRLSCSVHAIDN